MHSAVRASDADPADSASSAAPASAEARSKRSERSGRAGDTGAAMRPLIFWWRYRDRDLSIDQSLYLKLPDAQERLLVRRADGSLEPLPEDAEPGRDFLVEGEVELRLGQVAEVASEWLTLPMRRLYLGSPAGGFLELNERKVGRSEALLRRLDAFLSEGAGPYRIVAVTLRPEGEAEGW